MRNELHIFLSCLHRLTQCSRMFLARDQKCLCLLEDTAGELSPSAPSPLRGEGWGEAAALWILLANSLRLLPLHCVERAGVRPPPFGFASSIRKDGEPVIVCATSESSAIAHHWLQEQPLRLDHRAAGPLQSCRHLALLRRR